MKERPILFSGPMVRAILEGRKTQTRRVVKQVPHWQHCGKDIMEWGLSGCYTDDEGRHWLDIQTAVDDNSHEEIHCPHGKPGDRLWVRETWALANCDTGDGTRAFYRSDMDADGTIPYLVSNAGGFGGGVGNARVDKWRPSIFMPRWASRVTLEIVSVRVERLNEISEGDAKAEGCEWSEWTYPNSTKPGRSSYKSLWESINGPGSWDANPFVWVLEFKREGGR